MRNGLLTLVLLVSVSTGCGSSPGGDPGGGGRTDGPCTSLRVEIASPAEGDVLETWTTQVVGRVESAAEIRNLHYEMDGTTLSFPAIAGPFSFSVDSDRRSEVRIAVRARTVDGCTASAERTIHFDTSKWVELRQDAAAEISVKAPGDVVVVHWKPKIEKQRLSAPFEARERITGRSVRLAELDLEGNVGLTVQNAEMEIWDFDLGIEPSMKPLVISVGASLRMVPTVATVGVGESQWITIPNAVDARWTVDPAATLEPEGYATSIRHGMRFEADRPGTYTVRATSADGTRLGEAKIEVKGIDPLPVAIRGLPTYPEGFSAFTFAALPDGTLLAGGSLTYDSALLGLPRGGDTWTPFAEVGSEGRGISHLVVGDEGEVFALADAVLRISPDGSVERILESLDSMPITSIWGAGGRLYAVVGYGQTFAFDPDVGIWTEVERGGGCHSPVAASDERGLWLACRGSDHLMGPGFSVVSLAPIFDLDKDEEGRLLVATSRGVHRLEENRSWEQMAGGGPSGPGTVFLRSGRRLFAGNESGLWVSSPSDRTWVRLPVSVPMWPTFVSLPEGGIVTVSGWSGGDLMEIVVGE